MKRAAATPHLTANRGDTFLMDIRIYWRKGFDTKAIADVLTRIYGRPVGEGEVYDALSAARSGP